MAAKKKVKASEKQPKRTSQDIDSEKKNAIDDKYVTERLKKNYLYIISDVKRSVLYSLVIIAIYFILTFVI